MLVRLRWSAFGLRGQIVGMVLVTTVATLLVASIGLLPRLETSLRNASRLTLKNAIAKANEKPRGEITKLAAVPYPVAAEFNDDALRTDVPDASGETHTQETRLSTAIDQLHDDLGAAEVIMIGYIDPSDTGKVVTPGGPTATPAPAQFTADATSNAARAFRERQTFYSLPTIDGNQYVRAMIPLPMADDAVLAVYKPINEIRSWRCSRSRPRQGCS